MGDHVDPALDVASGNPALDVASGDPALDVASGNPALDVASNEFDPKKAIYSEKFELDTDTKCYDSVEQCISSFSQPDRKNANKSGEVK